MYILKKDEKAEEFYGLTEETITDEEITALIEGKRLWFSVEDEYAVVIKKGRKE